MEEENKELGLFIINFIQSELRILEGDCILNEIEHKNVTDISMSDFSQIIEFVERGSKMIGNMYQNEGKYEAYNNILKKLIEFKKKNEK